MEFNVFHILPSPPLETGRDRTLFFYLHVAYDQLLSEIISRVVEVYVILPLFYLPRNWGRKDRPIRSLSYIRALYTCLVCNV
jgi:hypothetical protein